MSEKKVQIFREKSLKAIESPESLHNYLRVTSPGVWLVLGVVIALLIGTVLWGVFGRIETSKTVAVVADADGIVCYVPYDCMESAVEYGVVTVNGTECALRAQEGEPVAIIDETDIYVRMIGDYEVGDTVFSVPVDSTLTEGVYEGTLLTERLNPISLLLQ